MSEWQPIETAPKDGTAIIVLSKGDTFPDSEGGPDIVRAPDVFLVRWNPEGTAWVDRDGGFTGRIDHLETTGTWDTWDGWLQPDEVTHWCALPAVPVLARPLVVNSALAQDGDAQPKGGMTGVSPMAGMMK